MVKIKISNSTIINSNDYENDLYTPPLSQSTICSDNINKINLFYNKLSNDISIAVKIIVILSIIGAILLITIAIYEEFTKNGTN